MLLSSRSGLQRLWKELSTSSMTLASPSSSASSALSSVVPWKWNPQQVAPLSTTTTTTMSTNNLLGHTEAAVFADEKFTLPGGHKSLAKPNSAPSNEDGYSFSDIAMLGAAVSFGSVVLGAFTRSLDFRPSFASAQSAHHTPESESDGTAATTATEAEKASAAAAGGDNPQLSIGHSYSSMVSGYWDLLRSRVSKEQQSLAEPTNDSVLTMEFLRSVLSKFTAPAAKEGSAAGLSFRQQQDAAKYFSELVMNYIASRLEDLPKAEPFWEELNIMTPLEVLRYALEEASDYLSPRKYDLTLLDSVLNDTALLSELTKREHEMTLKVSALLAQNPSLVQEIDEKIFGNFFFFFFFSFPITLPQQTPHVSPSSISCALG